MNLHAAVLYGRDDHHKAEALFKALGRALSAAVALDPRRGGVPSTKGTLNRMIAIIDYGAGNLRSVRNTLVSPGRGGHHRQHAG